MFERTWSAHGRTAFRRAPALAGSAILHTLCIALLIGPTALRSGRRAAPAAAPPPGPRIFVAPTPDDPHLPGLQASAPPPLALGLDGRAASGIVIPGGFRFDVRTIADRAALLFPFLVPGISLHQFALTPRAASARALVSPVAADASAAPRAAAPLDLDERAIDRIVDECWSRRDRWTPFQRIVALAGTHAADAGKLPALLRAYVERDGQQPYFESSIADPRLWTLLGLAAEDVSFVGFISRYTQAHPGTKAATELLFLLDDLAQGSYGVLTTLLDTNARADLQWTRNSNPAAYALIVRLQDYYRDALKRRGLNTATALAAYYDRVRLTVLNGIVQTTPSGYRADDARFLIGAIYWRGGRTEQAVAAWDATSGEPTGRYAAAYSAILAAIRSASPADPRTRLASRINGALEAEHSRWLNFSYDRLHRFGYRFDTF